MALVAVEVFAVCCRRGTSNHKCFLPLDFKVASVFVEVFVSCCRRGISNCKGFLPLDFKMVSLVVEVCRLLSASIAVGVVSFVVVGALVTVRAFCHLILNWRQ